MMGWDLGMLDRLCQIRIHIVTMVIRANPCCRSCAPAQDADTGTKPATVTTTLIIVMLLISVSYSFSMTQVSIVSNFMVSMSGDELPDTYLPN